MQVPQKYSPTEISLHSSKKDCWLVIHGKVYDVTTFLEDHPGGDDVLLHASATGDATQSFEDVGHSSTATSMMQGYFIGLVEDSEAEAEEEVGGGALKDRAVQEGKKHSSHSFFDYLLPLLILGLAFGVWYYLTYYNTKASI